jgi:hypothetical protein
MSSKMIHFQCFYAAEIYCSKTLLTHALILNVVFTTYYNNIIHSAQVTSQRVIKFQYFSLNHRDLCPLNTYCFTEHTYLHNC